jgi:succinate-semialdehyde dehydrogenase/glutarate-semialdehyde dehydrogenase
MAATAAPGIPTDTITISDPATGEAVGSIPAGGPAVVEEAVSAARAAQPAWAATPPAERAAALRRVAAAVRAAARELAERTTRESGKLPADARGGVEAGAGAIEQYAELGPLHRGRALNGAWNATDLMVHEPRGVAALLVPWNDPIAIAGGQLGACLVTGNTVVLKPSEKTPLSTIRLVELLDLPAGVLELLLGDERAGRPLAAHPEVDLVIHTGSIATGRELAALTARDLRKALLELGGKDPLVVDDGVDPAWAAEQAAAGAFANAGQLCTSVERIYVHEAVAEPFVAALVAQAEQTTIGPLIDAAQRDIVQRHVTDAVERGGEVRTGGAPADGPGFFYPPTVLTGCTDDMAIMREETFGPVAAVRAVGSFEDALVAANATEYGLAATVLTPSMAHAQSAWRELRAGTVKVNAVWGGAPGGAAQPQGASGTGFGYGPELLDEVTLTKVVHVEPPPGG